MHKALRILVSGIVAIILLNSLFFVAVAVYQSIHAFLLLAQGKLESKPGIHIAESLDAFMLSLFFIIFSLGIAKLFLPAENFLSKYTLPWLKIENFSQLKLLMWEVLLTTIFVYIITKLLLSENNLQWNILIYPSSILMLAVAYKLLKDKH